MRCRKARSLLSTFSNDEIGGRQQVLVREHLASCASCRKEYDLLAALTLAGKELPGKTVSANFNARVLDRIARERFAETRTKAYLPKRAPVFTWYRLAPVVASTALVAVVALNLMQPSPQQPMASQPTGLESSYLTAQPIANPNMTAPMAPNWSLERQLAKAESYQSITASLVKPAGFSNAHQVTSQRRAPYRGDYYRIRQIMRVYETTGATPTGEVSGTY